MIVVPDPSGWTLPAMRSAFAWRPWATSQYPIKKIIFASSLGTMIVYDIDILGNLT